VDLVAKESGREDQRMHFSVMKRKIEKCGWIHASHVEPAANSYCTGGLAPLPPGIVVSPIQLGPLESITLLGTYKQYL
jgi:hypothetical protein